MKWPEKHIDNLIEIIVVVDSETQALTMIDRRNKFNVSRTFQNQVLVIAFVSHFNLSNFLRIIHYTNVKVKSISLVHMSFEQDSSESSYFIKIKKLPTVL